jgi:asparagine synthase (glutamine-hydrolysing)
MFRYVAFLWNDRDPARRESARLLLDRHRGDGGDWRIALRGTGIEVRCAGERPGSSEAYPLADGGGVVLGKLFARSLEGVSSPAPRALGDWASRMILDSDGRHLIESFWGRYVAFLHDSEAAVSWVLRDPSAGLPCYRMRSRGVDIYFSWIEDVLELAEGPLTINWPYLVACLCLLREHCRSTALLEVSQVLAGECVEFRAGESKRSFYWDPLQIAHADVIEEPAAATAALAHGIRDVVTAWAASYPKILLSLSGGLVSSILLSCLAEMSCGPAVACFHDFPDAADFDERAYARLGAARSPFELLERPREAVFSVRPLLGMHPTPEPCPYPYYLLHSRSDAALAAERGSGAIFVGHGGSQLFHPERAEWALGDFLSRRGLRPGAMRVALDSSRMDQVSLWRVLRKGSAACLGLQRSSVLEEPGSERALLVPGVVQEARRSAAFLHPLLRHARGTPNGKLRHAHQITKPFDFYDPIGAPEDAERIAPLCSQPLMELCLRIPTYVLTSGGWDHGIARRAFFHELPPEIRNRRSQRAIEQPMRLMLERNGAILRELLLDGRLVREGIIDPAMLAEALSGRPTPLGVAASELLEYAGIEAWLRCWGGRAATRGGMSTAAIV